MDVSALKSHLGDDLYNQVSEKLGSVDGLTIIPTNDGSWVPKSRLTEEIDKRKPLSATIADLTKQLQEANQKVTASGTLQSQVDKLTKDLADRDQTITSMKRSGKIRDALTKAKAKDPALVEQLLDASKIGEDDKGNLTGVDDQVKSLKEKSAYLFDEEGGRRAGFGGGKDPASGGGTGSNSNSEINAAIRAAAGRSAD